MTPQYRNPFSKIRAEQMGDSAWKYFVEPTKDYIGDRPLIFEGSRGTGKTMFFKCNSWKEKFEEACSNGEDTADFIKTSKHLGFYYKVDGRFVKSLSGKNIEDSIWVGIFNSYFNLVIIKEIAVFLDVLIEKQIINEQALRSSYKYISLALGCKAIDNLTQLKEESDIFLLGIEKFSNNTNIQDNTQPIGLNAGSIIEKLISTVKQNDQLKHITFHVFIDEYEVLNRLQQIELNTLLKQSNNNLIYDFGVVTKGMQTFETGSGQQIQSKDDFLLFSIDRYGYYESKDYNQMLIDICRKRLKAELDKSGKDYDPKFLDISFYLKNYGKKQEEGYFTKKETLSAIKDRIAAELHRQSRIYGYTKDESKQFFEELINTSPVNMRIHLALLSRRHQNVVQAKELVKNKIENSKTYTNWIHNMDTAAIYLLCSEFKVEKKYHGLSVFSALSSGVIRSFLELAEYAFDYAMNSHNNPFNFEAPRELTIEEQTRAVYFVSNFKIKEIESYEPHGYRLKDFAKSLGSIFKNLQLNSSATLGEVEQNHFSARENDLAQGQNTVAYEIFKSAIRNKILEDGNPTKTKSKNVVETTDYHLNHIYCPAFGISHRRQNKISLSSIQLSKLLSGTQKDIEDVIKTVSGTSDDTLPSLFTNTDELPREI